MFRMSLPFQARSSSKNFASNGRKGRDTFGSKQNLSALSPQPNQGRRYKTYQMTWIWSSTSLAFDLSWMKVITASSSSSPPASNPGESWKMKPGLLLKVNERWTSWIPRYSVEISHVVKGRCRNHRFGTFEVGSSCWWRNDQSGISR